MSEEACVADDVWGAGAYAYILQQSPPGDDGLLPGLCLFTKKWLKQVPISLFLSKTKAWSLQCNPLRS
jgi:hypothetical protein